MTWTVVQLLLWSVAGGISFYFSIGSARVWTSIAVGFALVVVGEMLPAALPYLPWVDLPQVAALGYLIGTIAILVMSYGFLEFYVFSLTLEFDGEKARVYFATLAAAGAAVIFVLLNPVPQAGTLHMFQLVNLTSWTLLALLDLDLVRKIRAGMKGSPIAKGLPAFMLIFVLVFLWKGAELYLLVYDFEALARDYPLRYQLSVAVANVANVLAGLAVGGAFLYLLRLLR